MSKTRVQTLLTPEKPPAEFGGDLRGWLLERAQAYQLTWLLAHFDDGVNWGEVREGQLVVSHDCFPQQAPALRGETLQQARLFGPAGELFIWQVHSEWRGRFLPNDATDQTLSDQYLLWGDREERRSNGFVLLAEGAEGLRHAPPLPPGGVFDPKKERLGLQVQHYLDYDADGQAYIAASRLVALTMIERRQEK